MPEFNFAKGKSGGTKTERPSTAPTRNETGPARPVSADDARQGELPYELTSIPSKPAHASHGQPSSSPGAPPQADGGKAPTSILDKYPKRDFSHLTTEPVQHPIETAEVAEESDPAVAHPSTYEAENSEENAEMTASSHTTRGGTSWPIIIIGGVVVLLVLIALIWHVNPYPPLKDAIAGFFKSKPTEVAAVSTPPADQDAASPADDTELRSWDYFLQVSSWKELMKADQEAEKLRAAGLDVAVEGEALSRRGGTFYRVRLGPYESPEAAFAAAAAHPGLVPADAFLDSVRLTESVPVAAAEPGTGRPARMRREASRETANANDDIARWRKDFGIVDEPLSGYAVQVSSLRSVDVARVEARKMVEQGYPAFITRATIGRATWYRVLVGPFNTRTDADKYTKLINVTYGNEAYTVDLSQK
ncbi:MAG: SPOR domain-containing protein [Bacteroidia bacterium]|nr:SPOR domain-containing protein [Bacteroidia bacterium]